MIITYLLVSFTVIIEFFYHFHSHIGKKSQYPVHNDERDQFEGKFTNLNFFVPSKDINMSVLSLNLCDQQKAYYSWNNMILKTFKNAKIEDELNRNLCTIHEAPTTPFLIPAVMGFTNANFSCKKLVKGQIFNFKTRS